MMIFVVVALLLSTIDILAFNYDTTPNDLPSIAENVDIDPQLFSEQVETHGMLFSYQQPTYVLDFSRITIPNGRVVPSGIPIANLHGVARTLSSSARQQNFNMMPLGGTLRAGGFGTNRCYV